MSGPEQWDDGLHDFLAAVIACREEDRLALRVLGLHGNTLDMLGTGVKLMAAVLDEQDIDAGWFREWAQTAVGR